MYLAKNNKSPFYQVIYFVGKRRTTVSTKTKYKREAEKFLKDFKKNFNPDAIPEPKTPEICLSKFLKEYVIYIQASKTQSYIKSINLSFNMMIRFAGDKNLSQIDLRTIDKFIATTYARSPRSACLYYGTMKAAFSKAVIWNYLKENLWKKLKAPKVNKVFPAFITLEELQQILNQTKNQMFKDVFITAFYTGMRISELLNMKWSWIDFEKNIITVKCDQTFATKSKKERKIPINPFLRTVLQNRFPKLININKDYYVFRKGCNVNFHVTYISKNFKKAVRAAGINEEIHFHSLRHSFASNLVQKGVSIYVVKELLGHEDIQTTQIYSHLQQQNLMEAVNLL